MATFKFIPAFLFVLFYSCGQKPVGHQVDRAAVALHHQAMTLVPFMDYPDSSAKAILLLDEATSIDRHFFLAHYNKLMFYNQLRQFDKAIRTIDTLIELRPGAHDLYLTGGMLYEQVGDTVSSKRYFQQSLTRCNVVLDTMRTTNPGYELLVTNKAVNLIMLGDEDQGRQLLQQLYDRETDDNARVSIASLMNKRKKDLVAAMFDNPTGHE